VPGCVTGCVTERLMRPKNAFSFWSIQLLVDQATKDAFRTVDRERYEKPANALDDARETFVELLLSRRFRFRRLLLDRLAGHFAFLGGG
jgi:hypothetical protein